MRYHEVWISTKDTGLHTRATNQAWCVANRDKRKAQNQEARQARAAFIRECKTGKVCVKCQESDIDKLHFHHVDPATKLFTIGRSDRSIKAIIIEMAKCILLCNSCHQKHHKTKTGKPA